MQKLPEPWSLGLLSARSRRERPVYSVMQALVRPSEPRCSRSRNRNLRPLFIDAVTQPRRGGRWRTRTADPLGV